MSKSHLLINEPALQVLPSLAKVIGLNEAIVLQQLHYWLNNPKVGIEKQGEKWIFNTYEEWVENFPFWSVSTVKRIFTSLEEQGVVISAQLDAKQRDMTKFYRIDYAQLDTLEQVKLNSSIGSKRADVNNESENTTETNLDDFQTNEVQEHYSTAYHRGEQERPDKVSEWLKLVNAPGLKEQARLDALLSAFGEAFTVNTETAEWKKLAKHAISEQKLKGYDPQVFIEWVKRQKGYPEFWSCKRMLTEYPRAFVNNEKDDEKLRML
jgi:hypothetical protein